MPLKAAAAAARAAPSLDLQIMIWLLWLSLLLGGLLLFADCGVPEPPGSGLVTPLPSTAAAAGAGDSPWGPMLLLLLVLLLLAAAGAAENAVRFAAAVADDGAQRGDVQYGVFVPLVVLLCGWP